MPLSGTDLNDLSSQKKTLSRVNLVLDEKSSEHANKENNDHSLNATLDKSCKDDEHEPQDPLRCWNHLKLLINSSVERFNKSDGLTSSLVDVKLPIVLCAFSKGCIVLNELCQELVAMNQSLAEQSDEETAELGKVAKKTDTMNFMQQIRDLVWLDGGHCGVSNAWIVSDEVVSCIREHEIACYVYVTPYQMKSSKQWAVEEYKKFVELLKAREVRFQNEYYFQEKEDDYDIDVHFEILSQFDLVHLFSK